MDTRYKVERTRCNCHPETCCCDPYTITCDGEYFTRVFSKKAADKIADAMNFTFPSPDGASLDLELRKIDLQTMADR